MGENSFSDSHHSVLGAWLHIFAAEIAAYNRLPRRLRSSVPKDLGVLDLGIEGKGILQGEAAFP